jgi:hypothetical protein
MLSEVIRRKAGEGSGIFHLDPGGRRFLGARAPRSRWQGLPLTLLGASLVCLLLAVPLRAEDGYGAEFDRTLQKRIAQLPEDEKAWLDEPILDHTELLAYHRKSVVRSIEDYFLHPARLGEEPTPAQHALDQWRVERSIEGGVGIALVTMLGLEEMARTLGYREWLPAPSPLLQELPLPTTQLEALGFERSCATRLPSHSQRFNSAEGVQNFPMVDLDILPSREATRLHLLYRCSPSPAPNPRDCQLCETPRGEVCIGTTPYPGMESTRISFARGNVIAEVRGPVDTVQATANLLDGHIRKQLEASGVEASEVQEPVFVRDPEAEDRCSR